MAALERALGQAGERAGEAPRVRGDAVAGAPEQQVGVARPAQRHAQPCARGLVADQPVERIAVVSCSQPQRLAHARCDDFLVARAVDAHERPLREARTSS